METRLTKEIKNLTHYYKPQMSTGAVGRTIRWADEVWTPNGIVDSIRFEDYVENCKQECRRISYKTYPDTQKMEIAMKSKIPLGECKLGGINFPRKECKGCFYKVTNLKEIGMLTTAYEIKITKADFKSKNGHNIDDVNSPIGNYNYYCVPKRLVAEIEELVPPHVGILTCNTKIVDGEERVSSSHLNCYKKATFLPLDDKTKVVLLYNAMKKWCDNAIFPNNVN